ncbi:MAG: hypothetical protein L0Z55_06465, partial [Planctomycetes bacterium]|nr:hypothetical protein [Planctomycetota bacterium]
LQGQATALERRGLPGNAVVALLEAAAAGVERGAIDAEVARLRDAILELPLVRRVDAADGAAADAGRRFDGVTVLVGSASFRAERGSRGARREGIMVQANSEWRDNPAFAAEERRLRDARERAQRLHREWCSADDLSRAQIEKLYRTAETERTRCEARLRALPPRERWSAWRQEALPVHTVELSARLEIPLVIVFADGTREEEKIATDLRLEDRVAPADAARGLPADPEEFPPDDVLRTRLERDCAERLDALIERLQSDEARRLVPRAERCLAAGQISEGLELAVRALLEEGDPFSFGFQAALRLVAQWNPRGADALSRWFAPPPAEH